VVIGFLAIAPMLFGDFFKDAIFVNEAAHPAMKELAEDFHGATQMALHAFTSLPLLLAFAGVALAYYLYMVNTALPAKIHARVQPIYKLLEHKYFLDWFNENVLARGARWLGNGLWRVGDQRIIDGTLVNGSWKLVGCFSAIARRLQSGYLYHYALAMIVGIVVLMTVFVTLAK
jgi:NADH-quinone oxidoreductase subunit L